ncbi:BspA family leucine-rich repeat surface protein [Lactococcus piscium]|uniref:BspA family leucine-rich repeat surface protein n=1 Tax=Pseudolactococcus carnosus TaxID=2749961 RepID=UPI001FBB4037|nr:BspA family leucine-rich repeat surface protein [Lactococcus carnosus]MCJ1996773.1 BspA family leucine-rich repeat surface protein [Lactococcus carnosus]
MRLNKLFALFSLTLLSIGTPLTHATQAVAMNQNTPPISAASDNDQKNTKKQEARPEVASEQKAAQQKNATATNDDQTDDTTPSSGKQEQTLEGKNAPLKNDSLDWGNAPWTFDADSGTLRIGPGQLGETGSSPWNRKDDKAISNDKIKKIVFTGENKAPNDSTELFADLKSLTEIVGLEKLDTSNVTVMKGMFTLCQALTSLNLSNFDTRSVTTMQNMFFLVPLSSLTLGNNFTFISGTTCDLAIPYSLPDGTLLLRKWMRQDSDPKIFYTSDDLMTKYDYGKGELKAGTYVTEVNTLMSTLETTISFSADSGKTSATEAVIGDQLQGKLTVKHAVTSQVDSTAIAAKLVISNLLTDAWVLLPTATITTFNKKGLQTATEAQIIKNNELTLPRLPYGSYFEITFKGIAWEKAYASPSGNYNYNLFYQNTSGEQTVEKSGNFIINSGTFGFKPVPNIAFKDSTLSIATNQIIDRKDDNYAITVEDYRGVRLPDGVTTKPDRVKWEITATASPFKDTTGKEISLSAMAISFSKETGQTTELSSVATLITSHDVSGETAKNNHITKLSWEKSEGFKAIVHNKSGLEATTYTADVEFDLRTAP